MTKLGAGRFDGYAQGEWGEVGGICGRDGRFAASVYLAGLPSPARAQFYSLAKLLAAKGMVVNDQKFHRVQHDGKPQVWEMKIHPGPGHRFYCVQKDRRWLVTHGGIKPRRNGLYVVEVTRCKDTFNEWKLEAK